MGTTALRKVQFGRESTWGTSVAAAAIMSGVSDFSFNPGVTVTRKRYLSGSFAPAQTAAPTRKQPTAKLMGDVTPEDIIYLLDSSVKGSVSPTGAGPYVYAFTFPTTSDPAIRARTFEFYDGSYCWELAGGIVNKITFKGADGGDTVTYEAELIGKELTTQTVTGALSTRSFTVLPATSCALYIDSAAGTIGSTQISTTLIDWEWTFDMGHHTKFFMDGGLTATSKGVGIPAVSMKAAFEYNSSAATQLSNYLAGTPLLIRITGTNASSYSVSWDAGMVWTNPDDLFGDRDGNTTVSMTAEAIYDTGAFANYAKITVTNGVSAFVSNA